MYIVDGICYADKPCDMLEIVEAKPLENMNMLITFNTGEVRLFDASILQGSAFIPLKDVKVFNSPKIEDGVVVWLDGEIDCAPEFMYEHSKALTQK